LFVEAFVERDDRLQQFTLGRKEQLLVAGGEILPFGDQFGKGGIAAASGLAGPGQKEPDLQIEQVLVGKVSYPVMSAARLTFTGHVEQFQVAPGGLDHPLAVGGEKVLQQEDAVILGKIGGCSLAILQKRIDSA